MTNTIANKVRIVEVSSPVKLGKPFTVKVEYDANTAGTLHFTLSGYTLDPLDPEDLKVPRAFGKEETCTLVIPQGKPRSRVQLACTLHGASDQRLIEVKE